MDIPKEEHKKLGVPAPLFLVCLVLAVVGGAAASYFLFPQVQVVQKPVNVNTNAPAPAQSYNSDQYNYSFSYPGDLRLERSANAEGGYVKESIDLSDVSGKIRMSVKVVAKKGVQCPYYSLDQFVHCAFLSWQNVNSTFVTVGDKKGIRLVSQSQIPPYDVEVATYFEKGDYIFEVSDFVPSGELDASYNSLIQGMAF